MRENLTLILMQKQKEKNKRAVMTYLRWHSWCGFVRILFHYSQDLAFLIRQRQFHCCHYHCHSNPVIPNPCDVSYHVVAFDLHQLLIRAWLNICVKTKKKTKFHLFSVLRALYRKTATTSIRWIFTFLIFVWPRRWWIFRWFSKINTL